MSGISCITCTAGQALEFNEKNPHHFVSLNQLLEECARTHPDLVVAGFPERTSDIDGGERWENKIISFSSLLQYANAAATYFVRRGFLKAQKNEDKGASPIVALLSPSCFDFLVTLFAVIRLGYGVLLLAPQNNAEASAHLCHVTGSTHLICHPTLLKQANAAILRSNLSVEVVEMPPRSLWLNSSPLPLLRTDFLPSEERDRIALVFHTSGSTGMPKPVYQTHRIWTECMPCIQGSPTAFTTTPLYHGGISDLLRSMNSLSTTYLFVSLYPITANNVVKAVESCKDVHAFLSVPYVLKLLFETTNGTRMLQSMDIISTGGAPLPEEIGNEMVSKGINVVSRLGSSECGFLMSSAREYATDKAWSWLRNSGLGLDLLKFEQEGASDSFELVVSKGWPTLDKKQSVSNRPDGSYATGDLYIRHPTLLDVWRYVGRADDVIVLVNGKKASASPIENALRSSPYISEALVFGASRPCLGVFLLPTRPDTSRPAVLELVHAVNARNPTQSHILDELVVILPPDAIFPKSSKGTILRPRAYEVFSRIIDEAYEIFDNGGNEAQDSRHLHELEGSDLLAYVRQAVSSGIPDGTQQWTDDDDLFVLGVTSIHAAQIRRSLQKLSTPGAHSLSSNVVFEHPSVRKLVRHIGVIRSGSASTPPINDYILMRQLTAQYGVFPEKGTDRCLGDYALTAGDIAIVTGATGALGSHILYQLLTDTSLDVVALVRARNDEDAHCRVLQNLRNRGFTALTDDSLQKRLTCLSCSLASSDLGLTENIFCKLKIKTSLIVHAAWAVNFASGLESFAHVHLQGTRYLIDLAIGTSKRARFVFCSSTASAINDASSAETIIERLPTDETSASALGYARSKWVAEHICHNAHLGPMRGRIGIARVGQLCGDTKNGIWNESEGWPLLIASFQHAGCLPQLSQRPSWLPVDMAAKVIMDLASTSVLPSRNGEVAIIHVVNHNTTTSWDDVLSDLQRLGFVFQKVPPVDWLGRLSKVVRDAGTTNPVSSLLSLWETLYGEKAKDVMPPVIFDTTVAQSVSPTMHDMPAISFDLLQKTVGSWIRSGFLPSP